MKSPGGWALASMWYDKYSGVPLRGSPLETVFLLVKLHRQEAELLARRTEMRGQLAILSKSPEMAKAMLEAWDSYCDTMFPFLDKAKNLDFLGDAKSQLLEHIKRPMQIDLKQLRSQSAATAKRRGLEKYKVKPRKA